MRIYPKKSKKPFTFKGELRTMVSKVSVSRSSTGEVVECLRKYFKDSNIHII